MKMKYCNMVSSYFKCLNILRYIFESRDMSNIDSKLVISLTPFNLKITCLAVRLNF